MDRRMTAGEALARLQKGNEEYIRTGQHTSDVSQDVRTALKENGQHPFACVVTCSDSRVIPESVFSVGLGDLFVIRIAGNVVGDYVLGSIEYAVEHLGTPLVVVLGHTECGAVAAAMDTPDDTHIAFIVNEIKKAIGSESNPDRASCLNVEHSVGKIESQAKLSEQTKKELRILGGMYHIDSGKVEFFEKDADCDAV